MNKCEFCEMLRAMSDENLQKAFGCVVLIMGERFPGSVYRPENGELDSISAEDLKLKLAQTEAAVRRSKQ